MSSVARRGLAGGRTAARAALIFVTALALQGCALKAGSAAARAPSTSTLSLTLEGSDPRLSVELLRLRLDPSAANYRRVADEYRRAGVQDAAQQHYERALELDPTDAASNDALARIWRDWGMASIALPHAYRAASYAPESPEAANTVGTILQATGQVRLARQWYMRAINLDPSAAYARSNLCYALLVMQQPDALAECQAAAGAFPKSPAARNNLALAYAASGDLKRASDEFARGGDAAAAQYNMGIVHMAMRDYPSATRRFRAALEARPEFTLAAQRARQARHAAHDPGESSR